MPRAITLGPLGPEFYTGMANMAANLNAMSSDLNNNMNTMVSNVGNGGSVSIMSSGNGGVSVMNNRIYINGRDVIADDMARAADGVPFNNGVVFYTSSGGVGYAYKSVYKV